LLNPTSTGRAATYKPHKALTRRLTR
jgi:hypothetical protein